MTSIRMTALLASCAVSLIAQNVTGGLAGLVKDPSGAVVPNATVTATETGTRASFKTASNEEGEYTFRTLPVGTYRIDVEAPGFRKYESSGVRLQVNETARVDVVLTVGAAA